jgi:hypothetical protein
MVMRVLPVMVRRCGRCLRAGFSFGTFGHSDSVLLMCGLPVMLCRCARCLRATWMTTRT